jgi:hypothetical protein
MPDADVFHSIPVFPEYSWTLLMEYYEGNLESTIQYREDNLGIMFIKSDQN